MENNHKYEDEINFKAVIKTPIRWFGLVYIFFIIVVIIGGLFYIDSLPTLTANKVPPEGKFAEPFKDLVKKKAVKLEGVDVMIVSKPTDELIAQGKTLYESNCSSCHGSEGKGDGIAGAGLNPPPRNLQSPDGWKNGRKIWQLYKTLEEGIPGTAMVAYEYMPIKDRFAIIHYIRTFANDYPVDTEDELKQLDMEYRLSEGKFSENQIPVSSAIMKLSNEYKELNDNASKIKDFINSNHPGAAIFKNLAFDYELAYYSFIKNPEWMNDFNNFDSYLFRLVQSNAIKPSALNLNKAEKEQLLDFLKLIN